MVGKKEKVAVKFIYCSYLSPVLVFTQIISPRLQYITAFFAGHISITPLQFTTIEDVFKKHEGLKINYSQQSLGSLEIWIGNVDLLFEKGIIEQKINIFKWQQLPAFFKSDGDLTFDIFSASFYLLSRYEEYLPHQKDIYGRYAHENAIAFQENFLQIPLINCWIKEVKKMIAQKFPGHHFPEGGFKFLPTYDIDIAWSYKNKGWLRNTGGLIKSILKREISAGTKRLSVLVQKTKDPFDTYDWLYQLHEKYALQPVYFFLVAASNNKLDKNILPSNKNMQSLIYQHAQKYCIGLHPSWQSGDDSLLVKKELKSLENIAGKKINSSRQHFIRFNLPGTFRQLVEAGITHDYSMGYGSINGFRASVASSFFWYDLEKEEATALKLHPFCLMDANSFFEQKQTSLQSLNELQHFFKIIKEADGTMITIFHNTFLGDDEMFVGWKEIYTTWLQEILQ